MTVSLGTFSTSFLQKMKGAWFLLPLLLVLYDTVILRYYEHGLEKVREKSRQKTASFFRV